ncbi:hypothetical protein [Tissierella sp.]|uniref:hypothetical protein n=1 Tax=Tissierella sp. TaxID=41274 RepID=UPI002866C393|nr:hypothetical protein [Tissierella sp.]MDR7856095.1 hypothetical protein [Tissierella sp.]
MADIRASLEKQIEVLEKIQEKAIEENDNQKALEISHSIISVTHSINSLKHSN